MDAAAASLMAQSEEAFEEGLQHHRSGRLDDAIACYHRSVALLPANAKAWNNLGSALKGKGRLQEAVVAFNQSIKADPGRASAYYNRGTVHHAQRSWHAAAADYRRANELAPGDPDTLYNLGLVAKGLRDLPAAIAYFDEVIACDAQYAPALAERGRCFQEQGESASAVEYCGRAHALQPRNGKIVRHYAHVLNGLGRPLEAIGTLREFLQVCADAAVHALLIKLIAERAQPEAVAEARIALEAHPRSQDVAEAAAIVFAHFGLVEEAQAVFDPIVQQFPSSTNRFHRIQMMPQIYSSSEAIAEVRAFVNRELAALEAAATPSDEELVDWPRPFFYLSYQGQDDRQLNERLARQYLQAFPELRWVAPHCQQPNARSGKYRIGFVSTFFRKHTIGKLNRGLIANLDRLVYDVTVFSCGPEDDSTAWIHQAADQAIRLQGSLPAMRRQIAAAELDLLFYADIGMEPKTYALAFSRLAPVQCVTWGHPVTTGIPTVDYYVSDRSIEPVGAAAHYSECLIDLGTLPSFYYEPEPVPELFTRAEFGLVNDWNLYVCPQSLFKFHPEFYPLLAEILGRDPRGRLVLIEGMPEHTRRVNALLDTYCSDVRERIIFLPRLGHTQYLGLLAMANVLLDTIHFGGGNSTFEALSVGTPIVTWPGPFMRGRVTSACLHQLGMPEMIAADTRDYVEKALRIAQNADYAAGLRQDIRSKKHALFADQRVVDRFGRFFADAIAAARNGTAIEGWAF